MTPPPEHEIQTLGRKLLESARREEARLDAIHQWEYRLLDWCMENPQLRTRIFRFIDIFPQLSSPDLILQHVREYFPRQEDRIPAVIRQGLLLTYPSILTKRALARLTRRLFTKIAGLFISASNTREAVEILKKLDKENVGCSIDVLGEQTLTRGEAEVYQKRYHELIEALGHLEMGYSRQNVSIKLSALTPFFDPIDPERVSLAVRKKLRGLLRLAKERQVFIHIDMEEYTLRDLTLRIVRDILSEEEFKDGVALGIVLQAYLRDAERTLDGILSWTKDLKHPLTIRLVRGAYWDQEVYQAKEHSWPSPVFLNKNDTDWMFEHLTERIIDEIPHVRLAAATHNIRSIAFAASLAHRKRISSDDFEFQLLYGMGASLKRALLDVGFSPRMYMPIGDPVWGMSYLVRRLLENVSSQSFVRRGIHEKENTDTLLRAPHPPDQPAEAVQSADFEHCPALPLFREDEQKEFADALEKARKTLNPRLPLYLGRKKLFKSQRIHTKSPTDGRTPVVNASRADVGDVHSAAAAASEMFPRWNKEPAAKRAGYLKKAAVWMSDHRRELAAIEIWEAGKSWREEDADVREAIDFLNYYANAVGILDQRQFLQSLPHEVNRVIFRGRGVAAVIAPWNFPIAILTGMSAAALVTGNTVILKPAEQASLCGWKVWEAFRHAGVPPGVINFLTGFGEDIGPALVEHPEVNVIAFTGSKDAGMDIIRRSSAGTSLYVKKVICEMGGKNAVIIDETADFDQAIPAVLHSSFSYAGQKCSALSRLIVLESVYDHFVARLIQAAESFPAGHPANGFVRCGPVIDQEAWQRITRLIAKGRQQGQIIFHSEFSGFEDGTYIAPMIIADVGEHSVLWREEIFGPILLVKKAATFSDALRAANDSLYGLTGGVFSRTPSHIDRAVREFDVGNLYVNRSITGAVVGRQPFGGYRLSGTGTKAGSIDYLREFFLERTISENTSRHGFTPLDGAM